MKNKYGSSICVLNDSDTFTTTPGTYVIEHSERMPASVKHNLNDGDCRPLYDAVSEGKVKGRILNIAALVALYDVVRLKKDGGELGDQTYAAVEAVEA